MKNIIYTILLFYMLSNIAFAEDTLKTKIGLYGGIDYNIHTADFYKLQDIPNCCPHFTSGSGLGANFGALFEYRLSNSFWIGGRLGLMTLGGEMNEIETTLIMDEDGLMTGEFKHTMLATFSNVGLEPYISYNPIGNLQLMLGGRLGVNIMATYEQSETIEDADGYGTFIDDNGNDTHERSRNNYSGDMPGKIGFQTGLVFGAGYELPLNQKGTLWLVPELTYYLPFTDMVENTAWKVNSIKASIALKYGIIPKKPFIKEEIYKQKMQFDTVRIESDLFVEKGFKEGKLLLLSDDIDERDSVIYVTEYYKKVDTIQIPIIYNLEGNITAVGVDTNNVKATSSDFVVEEFVSNRLDPFLNYIFFDEDSASFAKRYVRLSKQEAIDFKPENLLQESTLGIYYNLLNLVGERLQQNPDAIITLVGCNAGTGNEAANIDLSLKRAESVRNYFVNIWDITPERIVVKSRELPLNVSTPIEEKEKMQENRRVEIYSDNANILEPIFIEKIDRVATPQKIRFNLEATSDAGLAEWKLVAYPKNDTTRQFIRQGTSEIPEYIDWVITENLKTTPNASDDMIYYLELKDIKNNRRRTDIQSLPIDVMTVEKKRKAKTGDVEVEKYSLILFDFSKSKINKDNQKIIDFISSRIKSGAQIEITGYADNTGDPGFNQKLALRRAKSAKKALGKPATTKSSIDGAMLYDTALPEGRFYCRTVVITVKTKIK